MSISPISNSVVAKQHTPIYSVHRYFARRPHNVFSEILKHYLPDRGLVLDPFLGGGVSAIEALTLGHQFVGYDVNALATFVTRGELESVPDDQISWAVERCIEYCQERIGFSYQYQGREVYWYGWDSLARCPNCSRMGRLLQSNSLGAGSYGCEFCGAKFRPRRVNASSVMASSVCVKDDGVTPRLLRTSRQRLKDHHAEVECRLIESGYLGAHEMGTPIPRCNLERESALHSKGFLNFEDFIPRKNQAWIKCFSEAISSGGFDGPTSRALTYLLSAAMRYFARFSCLNPAWRKGLRPLEWAKSNFWTPYSYVEVNPSDALRGRLGAYISAQQDHNVRFKRRLVAGANSHVLSGKADYALVNGPSQRIDLPDESVDLILTDPPYGSYLNYGELSGFWLAWLRRFDPEMRDAQIVRQEEAVTSRKKHADNYKDFVDYEQQLSDVFNECFRVLKRGRFMVFTFNNKEPEAWVALLRAVKAAGFELPKGGVMFQDGVEAYKRTIALRRDGAIHGDFIYSFKKPLGGTAKPSKKRNSLKWRDGVLKAIDDLLADKKSVTNTDLYLEINQALLPAIYESISTKEESDLRDFTMKNLEQLLRANLAFESGFWRRR